MKTVCWLAVLALGNQCPLVWAMTETESKACVAAKVARYYTLCEPADIIARAAAAQCAPRPTPKGPGEELKGAAWQRVFDEIQHQSAYDAALIAVLEARLQKPVACSST